MTVAPPSSSPSDNEDESDNESLHYPTKRGTESVSRNRSLQKLHSNERWISIRGTQLIDSLSTSQPNKTLTEKRRHGHPTIDSNHELQDKELVFGWPSHNSSPCSVPFSLPRPEDIVEAVSKAWQDVRSEEIMAGFQRCGISNSLDGSDDEMMDEQVQMILFGEQITSSETVSARSDVQTPSLTTEEAQPRPSPQSHEHLLAFDSAQWQLSEKDNFWELAFSDDLHLESELCSWNV